MTTTAEIYSSPRPVLVADQARTATGPAGPCPVCGHAMIPGDRICRHAATDDLVHVSCAATGQPQREPA